MRAELPKFLRIANLKNFIGTEMKISLIKQYREKIIISGLMTRKWKSQKET